MVGRIITSLTAKVYPRRLAVNSVGNTYLVHAEAGRSAVFLKVDPEALKTIVFARAERW